MTTNRKIIASGLLIAAVIAAAAVALHGHPVAVLSPRGPIAYKERRLMITAVLIGLIVVIPVFVMTFLIAWRYREGNKATYTPDWDHNVFAESLWWGLPFVIILVLSVITFRSAHELDPFKTLSSNTPPITIQVVALQWKWLFIYPEQHIATVNYVQFPMGTPVNFEITADAPMNSFWIPQLGGQIYAMAGMSTELHLLADGEGTYSGSSANLSGRGFASMKFTAESSSQDKFAQWVRTTQSSGQALTTAEYLRLAKPSENNLVASYTANEPTLYHRVMMKYMVPNMDAMNGEGTY